jgi:hypothetical protein
MSAIASVSEDGNIDDEDMEDMLTEVYKLLVGANIVSFGEGSSSDSSDDLSNKAKSLFDEVTGIGRDFIIGAGHSVDRDIFFGVEGINDSDMPNTTSYKVGSAFGDVLSIFAGESEMTVGGGGEVIGVALDGTVVLSPAGVAANVASAGLFVHGGHTMYEGASNLGKDLASFSSADGGAGEAETISHPVLDNTRTGSALKPYDGQHGFNDIIDNYAKDAQKFDLIGGDKVQRELYQIEGGQKSYEYKQIYDKTQGFNSIERTTVDQDGIFEWIVDPTEGVTHRRFIPGGEITGKPNQIPGK